MTNTETTEESKLSKKDFRDKYFIKDIENITGIKAYTLRIWEQRYNLLEPKRTDTNIRYYEEPDLKYMLNVSILNNNGWKISKIAKMSREEVQRRTLSINEYNSKYEGQIKALSGAMISFDEKEFTKILSINVLKLGWEETMIQIIFPFLEQVGLLWLSGSIHPAHEHFVSNLIRQRLYVAIDQLGLHSEKNSRKFLLFVPNGESHDLSLLFATYLLRSRRHEVIFLGCATPLEDLNNIFAAAKPDYLFCTLTASNATIPTQTYINSLANNWKNTQILLTGNQVIKRKDIQIPKNCRLIYSPQEFIEFIESDAC